jgi:hypothetical protein
MYVNLRRTPWKPWTRDILDSGSLASLDISDNNIGDEQEAKIKQICTEKSITITLTCEDDDSDSD